MRRLRQGSIPVLVIALLGMGPVCAGSTPDASTAALGGITARVMDEQGQPMPDVFIGFIDKTARAGLPILTRTNSAGLILLEGIAAGTYELLVRNSKFRPSILQDVTVRPGQTALVTVVLQQILGVEAGAGNVSLKALLRNRGDKRLIFRNDEGSVDPEGIFDLPQGGAVVRVYSNSGLDGDYFAFPADSVRGTTTSFAVENPLGLHSTSVLAGQLNSGEDSLWRLKSFLNYELSDAHRVQLFIGYGRLSFQQPALGILNEAINAEQVAFSEISGPLRALTLGVSDSWSIGQAFTMSYGVELNQIRTVDSQTFVNPHAEATYSPMKGTRLRLMAASKRATQGNSLDLPSGQRINLSDSFHVSRVGDQVDVGTTRYYRAGMVQDLGHDDEVEFTAFASRVADAGLPFALLSQDGETDVLQLSDGQADTRGYVLTFRHRFSENVHAQVGYTFGNAISADTGLPLGGEGTPWGSRQLSRDDFHAVATRLDAFIPSSRTYVTTLVKFVPDGNPLTTLDAYSDSYDTGNEGINVFVRQILPVPHRLFRYLGLDFLESYNFEAMLDVRNMTGDEPYQGLRDDLVLLRNPRSVRGGIAVRF